MSQSAEKTNTDQRIGMKRTKISHSAKGRLLWVGAVAMLFAFPAFAVDLDKMIDFNIPAQDLSAALIAFSHQAKIQVIISEDLGERASRGISGQHSIGDALKQLLNATGLNYRVVSDTSITIGKPVVPSRAAPQGQGAQGPSKTSQPEGAAVAVKDEKSKQDLREIRPAIPEILVVGSRTLDVDIKRTADDIQPYVVFDREQIEKSGSQDIQDFLNERLPSLINGGSPARSATGANTSIFNLRGLGSQQTLILVDGHRTTPTGQAGSATQPDINGIPLAAIERIEVLPTTASGIYGGGATGGVINIILRQDYRGAEIKLTYGDSFNGGGATRRVDFGGGMDFEGGKTTLLVTASYSDATPLLVRQRNFYQRGTNAILANDPTNIYAGFAPPLGSTTNIAGFDPNSGAPTNLVLNNGTSLNSPITFVPVGYAGAASDNGAGLFANAGRYNLGLANTAQAGAGSQGSLLNAPTVSSVMATLRRELTPGLRAFLEVSGSRNEGSFVTNPISGSFTIAAGAPSNPFQQDVEITTPAFGANGIATATQSFGRAIAGLIFDLPKTWSGEADYTWGLSRYSSSVPTFGLSSAANTAVNDGTVNVFRNGGQASANFSPYVLPATTASPSNTIMNDVTLRLSGPIGWKLPAGFTTLTASVEHRREALGDYTLTLPIDT